MVYGGRGRRNSSPLMKTLKDYAVPLIGGTIILVLIFNFFFSGNNEPTIDENTVGLGLSLDGADAEGYVVYPGDYKKKISPDDTLSLYKGEEVIVKVGNVIVKGEDVGEYVVNKLGEFKYNEDGSFSLYSSDVWVKNTANVDIMMRYANVKIGENSVLSISQNEVGSTIYLLQGFAEVQNLSAQSTVLAPGQKITVSKTDASNKDIDFSIQKEDFDNYFITSDWYIRNRGSSYTFSLGEESSTGNVLTGSTDITRDNTLSFDNLVDEQTVESSNIDIRGSFSSDIAKIQVGSIEGSINSDEKTFVLKSVALPNTINDLIIRSYNGDGDLIGKQSFTIYAPGTNSSDTANNGGFDVKNYSLDASEFQFTSPTENPYTTTEDLVTIRGVVPQGIVSKIEINGFTLTKFPNLGTSWRYHADVANDNLKLGLNVYEVKYYGLDGTIIHTNAFTIIKKDADTTNP